jgi:FtsP/CotA-like multicopper oxidase with cupredoxin domain
MARCPSLCDPGCVLGIALVALSLAAKAPPSPSHFLAVDAHRHRVTITLIASYDGTNNGFNFDGYSRYLMWTVPRGWRVRVVCENRGSLRHSCAVVQGAGSTRPAFRGAATPQPRVGLESGATARFAFRASRTGVYRFACLVPGHEDARMWDVLKITRGGRPSVVDLRAAG